MRHGQLLDLTAACILAVAAAAAWRLAGTLRSGPRAGRARRPAAVPERAMDRLPAPEPAATPGKRLRVNPIACSGHGLCAELLPELIVLDRWGYPVLADRPVPAGLARRATRAVTDCPVLALRLADPRQDDPRQDLPRQDD
jgi:ferredoxin